jgi:fatty acid synthase
VSRYCITNFFQLLCLGVVSFEVSVAPVSGRFEISENESIVATGTVSVGKPLLHQDAEGQGEVSTTEAGIKLSAKDIYQELRLRGYEYGPTFQGIRTASNNGIEGELLWAQGGGQWVTFLDTMLQMFILSHSTRNLRLPTRIRSLTIDVEQHSTSLIDLEENIKGGYNSTVVSIYIDNQR